MRQVISVKPVSRPKTPVEALTTAVKGARNTAITATSELLGGLVDVPTTILKEYAKTR